MTAPLWTPSPARIADANLTAFIVAAQERFGRRLPDRDALWRWSWEHMDEFWALLWDFAGVIGDPGDVVVTDADAMPGARFFPEGELNFAENLLRPGTDPALVFQAEDGPRREVSRQELRTIAGAVAAALRDNGVQAGDRVAAFLPNIPETMGAMLGAASLGAVWSSCSPDFGVQGVVDRFGQIEPVTPDLCRRLRLQGTPPRFTRAGGRNPRASPERAAGDRRALSHTESRPRPAPACRARERPRGPS